MTKRWIQRWTQLFLLGVCAAALAVSATADSAARLQEKQEKKEQEKPGKKEMPVMSAQPSAKKGKEVYDTYCEICHHSKSDAKKIGPGLKGTYKRGKFADGKKVDDRSMREWVMKGGKDMPAFEESLTAAELRDLIAYIRTL